MNILLIFAVVQAFNLVFFEWFNRLALVRMLVLRHQLGVYKRRYNPILWPARKRWFS